MITKEQLDNWESEVAYLRAEIARLTPTATRELPTREGEYRYQPDGRESTVVTVCGTVTAGGKRSLWGWVAASNIPTDLEKFSPGWWSREPIAEMVIPTANEQWLTECFVSATHGEGEG